ncbi:hypothetical protein, partial [Salmonella enterica]
SYAPVRARLVREPYRRIRKTSGYAGGYLFVSPEPVTVTDNLHNSLHFRLFLCVFGLAMQTREAHNQDPRGIDW